MSLIPYRQKRDFRTTDEPAGEIRDKPGWLYIVQIHAASHRHYDFRLQLGGVLKSWAIPKGPSLNPAVKRLAVQVEDHPVEYGSFEGIIPQGQYGGGTVMLWDRGDWASLDGDPKAAYHDGRLKFELHGEKLQGQWSLVRRGGSKDPEQKTWFLIKHRDEFASETDAILEDESRSVITNRTLDEIAHNSKPRLPAGQTISAGKAVSNRKRSVKPVRQSAREGTASESKHRLPRGASALTSKHLIETGGQQVTRVAAIPPQLATLVDRPPESDQWLNEIKFDGYRMCCQIRAGRATFISRNQQDWTSKLPSLADVAAGFPVENAVFDGEVVALDDQGISRFQLLQNAFRNSREASLKYYVFDLLSLNGIDLTGLPLETRKDVLQAVMQRVPKDSPFVMSDHVIGEGPELFEHAKKMGLEGIISKRRDRPYLPGRSRDWLKSKCFQREEFVIGGYTDPNGGRMSFGALLLGYYNSDHKLIYAGKVGTGFDDNASAMILRRLEPIVMARSAFTDFPSRRESADGVHWTRPQFVAQVEFSNWTDDGRLRHPAFGGLRDDKPADDVVRDPVTSVEEMMEDLAKNGARSPRGSTQGVAMSTTSDDRGRVAAMVDSTSKRNRAIDELIASTGVQLTHPDKVLFADESITKQELARYYVSAAAWMLPHVEHRLAVLVRCPEGLQGECFYQKHPGPGTPSFLQRIPVKEQASTSNYLVINDLAGLVWLAQSGALELHVWGSRIDDIERPDRLVFDLDPAADVDWSAVVESAREFREVLRGVGLESFVRTTGGHGLHLVVPIQRRSSWDEAKTFCHAVATSIEAAAPDRFTSKMSKAARKGKIFIDYLRNQRGATSIACYSPRSRAGAPVATPIHWDELSDELRSDQFHLRNIADRFAELLQDPWKELFTVRQSITAAAKKSFGL
ncbi:DNA ligase D [Schlesneria paludicola]|uniref:DNA ligase D n=1 Tax=Schlesneria paludicola TaxID=360056 RepID=UPI00029AFB14|nr:DNA ligase D [Schlesneria paludicola]